MSRCCIPSASKRICSSPNFEGSFTLPARGADAGTAEAADMEPILTTAASFSLSCIPGFASSLNGSLPSNQAKILKTS
jgi:hypothetical protein